MPEARLDPRPAVAAGDPHVPRHVVGVVASLGGIAALRRLLAGLPADLPAAVLVVQHVERRRPSRIAEMLAPSSALPVHEAREGEAMAEGVVYVAPPDRHLLAGPDGRLVLCDAPPEHWSRPSGDPLFRSIAAHYGPRGVAVVLTGRDSDGCGGVPEVRAAGGTVLVQDPQTALDGSMPRASIRTGAVDQVLSLDDIAPALVSAVAAG
jgi:two-component system chemotaxis response regulator CheB